jgi:hypothetical protein
VAPRRRPDGDPSSSPIGRPAHVLLTIEDYRRLSGGNMSLVEAIAQVGVTDFEFEPPRTGPGIFKLAKLG